MSHLSYHLKRWISETFDGFLGVSLKSFSCARFPLVYLTTMWSVVVIAWMIVITVIFSGMLQWYNIESWLLHTSLLSACFWLCSFIVLRLGRPSVRKDHRIYVDGHPEMSIRCVLLVIYLIAAIIATIALWMDTVIICSAFSVIF